MYIEFSKISFGVFDGATTKFAWDNFAIEIIRSIPDAGTIGTGIPPIRWAP
jgi:hypothetical protein